MHKKEEEGKRHAREVPSTLYGDREMGERERQRIERRRRREIGRERKKEGDNASLSSLFFFIKYLF